MTDETPQDATQDAPEMPENPEGAHEGQERRESTAEAHQEAERDSDLTPEAKELKKLRQEAAQRRTAHKEARAEADALRSQLTTFQDSMLTAELAKHHVSFDAFQAAGARDKVFNKDGTLSTEAVATEARAVAQRFGTVSGPPPEDPNLGRETPPGGTNHGLSWAEKINPRR